MQAQLPQSQANKKWKSPRDGWSESWDITYTQCGSAQEPSDWRMAETESGIIHYSRHVLAQIYDLSSSSHAHAATTLIALMSEVLKVCAILESGVCVWVNKLLQGQSK